MNERYYLSDKELIQHVEQMETRARAGLDKAPTLGNGQKAPWNNNPTREEFDVLAEFVRQHNYVIEGLEKHVETQRELLLDLIEMLRPLLKKLRDTHGP